MTYLEHGANAIAILTAVVAVSGFGVYHWRQFHKCQRLERYLKSEKAKDEDRGQRSLVHLMAKVGLTESELKQASIRSKHIVRKIVKDGKTGRADSILLEWKE